MYLIHKGYFHVEFYPFKEYLKNKMSIYIFAVWCRARTQTAGGTSGAGGGVMTEGRQPVRRAHSEMETSASGGPGVGASPGGGVGAGQPPSHPVSLEAISSQPPPPGAIPRR